MGLGSARDVKLREAQGLADDARRQLRKGVDPIAAKRALAQPTTITFAKAAEQYIAAHEKGWRNAKHGYQWSQSLETYAYPTIGKLAVDKVDANHIVTLLTPIWSTKSETADRVRNRIERVLGWATNAGYRTGPNPAAWRDGLQHRLPPLSRVRKIEHHVAIPYADLPGVFRKLSAVDTTVSRCLRLVAMTATRVGEARLSTWSEFDLDADTPTWSIPGEHTKTGKPHRVPLSPAAVALVRAQWREGRKPTEVVFHGPTRGKAISDTALRVLLRKHGPDDADTHGLRSSFRDWAAEKTTYPSEVPEAALAHELGTKVTTAYLRSDFFEQRTELMALWATHLDA
jgi:integrase